MKSVKLGLSFLVIFMVTFSGHATIILDGKENTQLEACLKSDAPIHTALNGKIPAETLLKFLDVFHQNRLDFNKRTRIEGYDLCPMGAFLLNAPHYTTSDVDKAILQKLQECGAELTELCIAQIMKKYNEELLLNDTLGTGKRARLNTLLVYLDLPTLDFPEEIIDVCLTCHTPTMPGCTYYLKGIKIVTPLLDDSKKFMTLYFNIHLPNKPPQMGLITLRPHAAKLALMMFAGVIAPQELITKLAELLDLEEADLLNTSDIAYLASLAPGFDEPSSKQKQQVLDDNAIQIMEDEMGISLRNLTLNKLFHIEDKGPSANGNFSVLNLKTETTLFKTSVNIDKNLEIHWTYADSQDDKNFVIHNPLAQSLALEILVGIRPPNHLRDIFQDILSHKASLSDFAKFVFTPRNFRIDEGYHAGAEVHSNAKGACITRYRELMNQHLSYRATNAQVLQKIRPDVILYPHLKKRSYSTQAMAKPFGGFTMTQARFTPLYNGGLWGRFMPMLRMLKRL